MRSRILGPGLIVLILWSVLPAQAATRPHGRHRAAGGGAAFEVNPYFTSTDFETDLELDDEFGAGLRVGYLFTPHHEVEFLLNGVDTNDTVFPDVDVEVTNIQMAYVFNFTSGGFVPYVTAGLGILHTDDASLGEETNQALGLGAGARFFLGRSFYARFEWRASSFEGDGVVYALDRDVTVREVAFGIGWRFDLP
jgi:opacity protein-like surface antigen